MSRFERKTQSWSLKYLLGWMCDLQQSWLLRCTCCQTWQKYNETLSDWPRFHLNVLFPVGCPHAVLPVFFFPSVTNQCQHQQTNSTTSTHTQTLRQETSDESAEGECLKPFWVSNATKSRLNNAKTKYNVLLILISIHYISYSKNMNERGQHTRVQVTERTL